MEKIMTDGVTFGIMTIYDDVPRLNVVIESIKALKIPQFEILVAGSYNNNDPSKVDPIAQHILSDGWLPKKKNMVARAAYHDTLVLLHDYYVFDPSWYQAFVEFGNQWDVCSNPQLLLDGTRHATDWITWDHPKYGRYWSLPYDDWSCTKYQYCSGGYFLVKRDFLRSNPINEAMPPGSPEDVEWSLRIRDEAVIKCNPNALVRHNKRHRDVGNKTFPLFLQTPHNSQA
jgi:hypothetical protein